jgi:hypothetical protein
MVAEQDSVRRVPEECPQEIADLIQRCQGDASQRPDAQECAQIIAQFVPSVGARRLSSRSMAGNSPCPAPTDGQPGRTTSGKAPSSGVLGCAHSRSLSGGSQRPEMILEGDPQQPSAGSAQPLDAAQKTDNLPNPASGTVPQQLT